MFLTARSFAYFTGLIDHKLIQEAPNNKDLYPALPPTDKLAPSRYVYGSATRKDVKKIRGPPIKDSGEPAVATPRSPDEMEAATALLSTASISATNSLMEGNMVETPVHSPNRKKTKTDETRAPSATTKAKSGDPPGATLDEIRRAAVRQKKRASEANFEDQFGKFSRNI